jgi:hypothetical protein
LAMGTSGGNCGGAGTPPVTDGGYNISDDTTCGFTGTGANGKTIGDSVSPQLDPKGLQSNGGPTQTIALLSTSPAIDAIPIAQCLATDQRGTARPDSEDSTNPSPACDIGAFEFRNLAPTLAFPVHGFTPSGVRITPWSPRIIISIFDHWMQNPYGCGDTNPDAAQTLMAFTGEEAGRDVNGQRDTDSQNVCKPTPSCSNLYGWSNPNETQFSLDGTYTGVPSCGNQKFLEYDGHPGIDYAFSYGTAVFPASTGIVHYPRDRNGAAGGSPAQNYHTLEIDPGNGSVYRIFYLHLSSYICSSILGDPDFWSGCANSPGQPVRCVKDNPSTHKCLDVQPCSTCAREGVPVDVNQATPIGYTGDYDLSSRCKGGWGCVGAHLHFQVDKGGTPVDPYGYDPQVSGAPKEDPYSSKFGHPAGINVLLWKDPRP